MSLLILKIYIRRLLSCKEIVYTGSNAEKEGPPVLAGRREREENGRDSHREEQAGQSGL